MKRHSRVTFKPYTQHQASLLPPSLDELVPPEHLVRVVDHIIDQIDLAPLLAQYKGGGSSSFHPKMMLKVLVYAYTQRLYASRQIAKALREQVPFMWLSGQSYPDFRTLNDFRGKFLQPVIEPVFGAVLQYLIENEYVPYENYFVDGTKIEANANRHQVVWRKRLAKQQARLQTQIQALVAEIEQANAAEQAAYGERDLPERGGGTGQGTGGVWNAVKLEETIAALNAQLAETGQPPPQALHQLAAECLPRQRQQEAQAQTLGKRNSYAKHDPEATCLRMKEDRGVERPWPKPAYNVQLGTEGQFVVGFSVHQRAGDTGCLVPHLQHLEAQVGRLPKRVIADAGYGSEENYAYLRKHELGAYVKYNSFHQDQIRHRKPELQRRKLFRSHLWPYDPVRDELTCPAGMQLTWRGTTQERTDNGYLTERRHYETEACASCPLKPECTKAKGNRQVELSLRLRELRAEAARNLQSAEGQSLRAQRSVEVESVFGQIKHNRQFRRFRLRGLAKVTTEWGLVCLAHNMQKVAE